MAHKYYEKGLELIKQGNVEEGVRFLENAANDQDELSAAALVNIYDRGLGVEKDYMKATMFARAYVMLNPGKAIPFIKEIAKENFDNKPAYLKYILVLCDGYDKESLIIAGDLFMNEEELRDPQRALGLYKKAYELNCEEAAVRLYSIYKNGLYSIPKNDEEYFNIVTKLAENNPEEPRFIDELVSIYENGTNGVAKNYPKALEIYTNLAEKDICQGIYKFRLAEIYETGRLGVKVDTKKAIDIFQDLLSKYPTNEEYQFKMAQIFENGSYGVAKDLKKASQIYRTLLTKNPENVKYIYALAMFNYRSPDAEDQKQAYIGLQKAFNLGIREAGYDLAILAYNGGTKFPKDYKLAVDTAAKITDIVKNATLSDDEEKRYFAMKSLEIQMYANGGPRLQKSTQKAKAVMQEFNDTHKDKKIKVKL